MKAAAADADGPMHEGPWKWYRVQALGEPDWDRPDGSHCSNVIERCEWRTVNYRAIDA